MQNLFFFGEFHRSSFFIREALFKIEGKSS
jgi:hypothetical protein